MSGARANGLRFLPVAALPSAANYPQSVIWYDQHGLYVSDGVNWNPIAAGAAAGTPSAKIGLTAVNGTALTYMPSDAAPALDQAIAPTWTAVHTFTAPNQSILIKADTPTIEWQESAASMAADTKRWQANVDTSGNWRLRTLSDDGATLKTALGVSRTGSAITALAYGNAVDYPAHSMYGTLGITVKDNTQSALVVVGPAQKNLSVISSLQTGQVTWLQYSPASADTYSFYNSSVGAVFDLLGSGGVKFYGAATFNSNQTVIGSTQYSSQGTGSKSWLTPGANQQLYSLLGANLWGPGIQARWDSSTTNRYLSIGYYSNPDNNGNPGAFSETVRFQDGVTTWASGTKVGVGASPDSVFAVYSAGAGFRVGYNNGADNYYDATTHRFRTGVASNPVAQVTINSTSILQSLNSGAYSASAGAVAGIVVNNTAANAQSVIEFQLNGAVAARVRADYVGGMSYIANGSSSNHAWFVGGDSGPGTQIMTLDSTTGLKVNTNLNVTGILTGNAKGYLFNNQAAGHGTYTSFAGPTEFGFHFVHQDGGINDGPGFPWQFFVQSQGLGGEYGYSQYAMQRAINRTGYGPRQYEFIRFKENGSWTGWTKLSAGLADQVSDGTHALNPNNGNFSYGSVWATGAVGAYTGYVNNDGGHNGTFMGNGTTTGVYLQGIPRWAWYDDSTNFNIVKIPYDVGRGLNFTMNGVGAGTIKAQSGGSASGGVAGDIILIY